MKLPLLSGRQVLSALTRLGFMEVHRKGSHVKMKHADGRLIVFLFMTKLTALHSKARYETLKLRLRIF